MSSLVTHPSMPGSALPSSSCRAESTSDASKRTDGGVDRVRLRHSESWSFAVASVTKRRAKLARKAHDDAMRKRLNAQHVVAGCNDYAALGNN
jgi:hypothetical protein